MNTYESILEVTRDLIQSGGYNSFSYLDIATKLEIKRASIHYYFPRKSDLGKAVVIKYIESFQRVLDNIQTAKSKSNLKKLDEYLSVFAETSDTKIKICLCGALGGEYLTLPKEVRKEVDRFFKINLSFLKQLLENGVKSGEFHLDSTAENTAALIFSSLEGGLIVARSKNSPKYFKSLIKSIKASIII